MFIAELRNKGLQYRTIRTYISAISFVHKMKDVKDTTSAFSVIKTLQGFLNSSLAAKRPTLLPITKDILHKIINSIKFATECNFTRIMLRALFLTSYYACLCIGEAVYSQSNTHTLLLEQIRPASSNGTSPNEGYLITFTSYKHSGGKMPTMSLGPINHSDYCPVKAMHAYLRVRGTTPGPLFIDVTLTPITRATFLRYLNICLQLADIPSDRYNTHSFRIGRATQLAKENCSESIIKTTGRWKSDAFKKYIRPSYFKLPL